MTQQDESKLQLTDAETAWLAGILDGEGCFHRIRGRSRTTGKRYWSPAIALQMTDRGTVERVAELTGRQKVGVRERLEKTGGKHKDVYALTVTGWPALDVMDAIRPWLSERRRAKIDELKAEYLARDPGRGKNGRFTHKNISELHDEQWLRTRYEAGGGLRSIASELGCSSSAVWRGLLRFGIERHGVGSPRKQATQPLADAEWLYERYVDGVATTSEIAAELKCCPQTVVNALRRHEIPVRHAGKRTKEELTT